MEQEAADVKIVIKLKEGSKLLEERNRNSRSVIAHVLKTASRAHPDAKVAVIVGNSNASVMRLDDFYANPLKRRLNGLVAFFRGLLLA